MCQIDASSFTDAISSARELVGVVKDRDVLRLFHPHGMMGWVLVVGGVGKLEGASTLKNVVELVSVALHLDLDLDLYILLPRLNRSNLTLQATSSCLHLFH